MNFTENGTSLKEAELFLVFQSNASTECFPCYDMKSCSLLSAASLLALGFPDDRDLCFQFDVSNKPPLSVFPVSSMGRRRCVRTAWTPTSRTSTSPSWTPATSTASTASASCSGAPTIPPTCRRPPSTTTRRTNSSRWGYTRWLVLQQTGDTVVGFL